MERLAVAVAVAVALVFPSSTLGGTPRKLRITPSGRAGPLRLDASSGLAVIRLMGWPEALGSGNFGAFPRRPNVEALGYSCGTKDGRGTSVAVPGSGLFCQLIFYINTQTLKLAAVWSYSPMVVGPDGIQSGDPATIAEQRLRTHAVGGCYAGFSVGRSQRTRFFVSIYGGAPISQSNDVIVGGTVGALELESKRHPVGLLFC